MDPRDYDRMIVILYAALLSGYILMALTYLTNGVIW